MYCSCCASYLSSCCVPILRCLTALGSLRLFSFNSLSSTSIVFILLVVSVQSSSSFAFSSSSSSSSPPISLILFPSQFSWTLALSWPRRLHCHQPHPSTLPSAWHPSDDHRCFAILPSSLRFLSTARLLQLRPSGLHRTVVAHNAVAAVWRLFVSSCQRRPSAAPSSCRSAAAARTVLLSSVPSSA